MTRTAPTKTQTTSKKLTDGTDVSITDFGTSLDFEIGSYVECAVTESDLQKIADLCRQVVYLRRRARGA